MKKAVMTFDEFMTDKSRVSDELKQAVEAETKNMIAQDLKSREKKLRKQKNVPAISEK
ncbi:MAG: hypothetical protein LBQ96_04060 [Fusobacteriaceae bacterium]|jgi:hypothetical protein|nr:hypothetical protein [Fusobacteriaceae bacterium]